MGDSDNSNPNKDKKSDRPAREIANSRLFAADIVFSDTEKILFEEDLQEGTAVRQDLMDGNPADRYTPHKKLNQGGMKDIWEVDDHRTARKVAMALIQDSRIASEEEIDSFLYEARLTANLQHPNIIPIYDIAVDENGNPYFTMKALRGETLGDIISKLRKGNAAYRERYTRTRLLGIFLKVCNAIDYAHTKGVIHLDLKPSNVIVGDFGDVHVLDWGLSTLVTHLDEYEGEPISWHSLDDVALENGQSLTRYLENSANRRHAVGGTPGYMSPEQAQGVPAEIDFQTDVYMLGALLYELLTYECPITGSTVKDVLQKTVRGDFPDPIRRAPGQRIPPALAAITMKAMQTDPAERYAHVAALIQDIHQYQDGFATIAENPTFVTHVALLIRRHKMAVGLIAASTALIAVILTNSFISIKKSEQATREALQYIEKTAKLVAPDYLELYRRAERAYAFAEAEEALDTSLAFDPSNESAWAMKAKLLLSQGQLLQASQLLSEHPSALRNTGIRALIEQYTPSDTLRIEDLPRLVADLQRQELAGGLPRLFFHANQSPASPETHFQAIRESLELLNPGVSNLHFAWSRLASGAWSIDISNNPGLDDLTPLCGLNIARLEAARIGSPDPALLQRHSLRKLNLSNSRVSLLAELQRFGQLEELNISGTGIRNLSGIVELSRLSTLDISNIDGLTVSPQLIWCRNLQLLTVSKSFRTDPTIQTLARRGVIIIYSEE